MQWVTLECEACGAKQDAKSTDKLWHARCPKRTRGKNLPRYVLPKQPWQPKGEA